VGVGHRDGTRFTRFGLNIGVFVKDPKALHLGLEMAVRPVEQARGLGCTRPAIGRSRDQAEGILRPHAKCRIEDRQQWDPRLAVGRVDGNEGIQRLERQRQAAFADLSVRVHEKISQQGAGTKVQRDAIKERNGIGMRREQIIARIAVRIIPNVRRRVLGCMRFCLR